MQSAVVATSDKLMTDYHRILELPKHATEEQIRSQYKRLVRIYHPDRFTNAQDKVYVEEKLCEINHAYQMLLERAAGDNHHKSTDLAPQPAVMPTALDFGNLVKFERKALLFQLQNNGGPVQNFQLDYSEDSSWFKVAHGRRLHKQRPFPMEFSVVVDTSRLELRDYSGWIQVHMDNATLHIPIRATVVAPRTFSFLTPRIALALSMLAMVILMVTFQLFDFILPIFSLSSANSSKNSVTVIADSDQIRDYNTPLPLGEDIDLIPAIVITPTITVADAVIPSSALHGRVGLKPNSTQNGNSAFPQGSTTVNERQQPIPSKTATTTSIPTVVTTATMLPSATATLLPPTLTPSFSSTPLPLPSLTATSVATVTPSLTKPLSPTVTSSSTTSPSPITSPSPTVTLSPSATPSAIPSLTPSSTPSSTIAPSPTVTPLPTVTPSWTPSATMTPLPTAAASPTSTPSSTLATATRVTFSQTSEETTAIRIPANYNVNARADISINATVVQILPSETEWIAVGRTIDATWLYIALGQEQYAWVYTETILVDEAAVNTLPIIVPTSFQ